MKEGRGRKKQTNVTLLSVLGKAQVASAKTGDFPLQNGLRYTRGSPCLEMSLLYNLRATKLQEPVCAVS